MAATASVTYGYGRQSFYGRFGKRALDVALSVFLLVMLSPVMLAIAGAIAIDSPGRVIFTQQRVGRGGRPFTIYKFRSMVVHGHIILETNPLLAAQYAADWKLIRDPRVTRCGTWLRKSSLDELPQLWNVLIGDMSIVGPRPYMPHELDGDFGHCADLITTVKPGITGPWQVSGRSHLGPAQRIALDEEYAQWSDARLDALLLCRTVKVVAQSTGAF